MERWTPAYSRLFQPDHELGGDPANRRWAFLDLCHLARWRDGVRIVNGTPVPLKRGEVLASLRYMADRWCWSITKVRRFLELLHHPEIHKLETVRDTPQGTVYRIVGYDVYASPDTASGTPEGTAAGGGALHPRNTHDTKNNREYQGVDGISPTARAHEGDALGGWLGEWAPMVAESPFAQTARDRNTLYSHYGPPGMRVKVWELDDGSKVPAEERPRIFALALTGYTSEGRSELVTSVFAGMVKKTVRQELPGAANTVPSLDDQQYERSLEIRAEMIRRGVDPEEAAEQSMAQAATETPRKAAG